LSIATFMFGYAGTRSDDHNVTLYLRPENSDPTANSCPGLPGATVAIVIDSGGTVNVQSVASSCPDRTPLGQGQATPTATGWSVTVPNSETGLTAGSVWLAGANSSTRTGPNTETVIEDFFPDEGQDSFVLAPGT
jgi:hypothetical protein